MLTLILGFLLPEAWSNQIRAIETYLRGNNKENAMEKDRYSSLWKIPICPLQIYIETSSKKDKKKA